MWVSEFAGSEAIALDKFVRRLGLQRVARQEEAQLSNDAKAMLTAYAAGVNWVIGQARRLPLEFRLLGIRPEPWTIADVLGIARLAAADINWLLWMRLLRVPRGPDWPEIWARLIEDGTAPLPSLGSGHEGQGDQRQDEHGCSSSDRPGHYGHRPSDAGEDEDAEVDETEGAPRLTHRLGPQRDQHS